MRTSIIWRTMPPSTEGSKSVYVHAALGSDLYGNGTRNNPYQSLNRAWNGSSTRPERIIAIGRFAENLPNGNHSCYIVGDYYGAFEFDGEATDSTGYYIYGFFHTNAIIRNVPTNTTLASPVWSGSAAFAGVGAATSAAVGNANAVYGVGASPCFIHNASLYYGCIGGVTASSGVVISKPKRNSSYPLWFGGHNTNNTPTKMTIYSAKIEDRSKKINNTYITTFTKCIFADFPMIANDVKVNYNNCLFLADSEWWYLDSNNGSGARLKLTLSGSTSAERQQSLLDQLNAEYESRSVASASRYIPTFTNCIFSDKTSEDIFNNPKQQDFTLKVIKNGVLSLESNEAILSETDYIGALPPAMNIPIYADSTAKTACWDNNTATGSITVSPIEGSTLGVIAANPSVSGPGQILSKIIAIDPSKLQINGVYSPCVHHFNTANYLLMNDNGVFGETFNPGDILPVGRYQARGFVVYNGDSIADNNIVVVSTENTTFSASVEGSNLVQITDPNVHDVVFVRCRAAIYKRITAQDGLQSGATYINDGKESITYRTRTIVSGESFVAVNNSDTFSASSGYTIGVLFDDTRVPLESPWVPAQLFGTYYVSKVSGVIQTDKDGVPLGSGNPLCYRATSGDNTDDKEGYSTTLNKTIVNQRYVQFAIIANKYR